MSEVVSEQVVEIKNEHESSQQSNHNVDFANDANEGNFYDNNDYSVDQNQSNFENSQEEGGANGQENENGNGSGNGGENGNHDDTYSNNFVNDNSQNGDDESHANNGQDASNGNGNGNRPNYDLSKLEPEQLRKVFVGSLNYNTTEDAFRNHFSQFGELVDCVIMKEPKTNKSRGFGFVTYVKSGMVDEMMKNRPHKLDGRELDTKRATPREESGKPGAEATTEKLFVGAIKEGLTEDQMREYFSKYGNIQDCVIIRDKESQKSRGFGFVTFDDYDPVDKIVLEKFHTLNGQSVAVKKALPKEQTNNNMGGGGNFGGHGGNRNYNNYNQNPNFNNNRSFNDNDFNGSGFNSFANGPGGNFNGGGMGGPGNFGGNMQGTGFYNQIDGDGGRGGNNYFGNRRNNNNNMGGGGGRKPNMGMGNGGGPIRNHNGRGRSGPYGGGPGGMRPQQQQQQQSPMQQQQRKN